MEMVTGCTAPCSSRREREREKEKGILANKRHTKRKHHRLLVAHMCVHHIYSFHGGQHHEIQRAHHVTKCICTVDWEFFGVKNTLVRKIFVALNFHGFWATTKFF